MTALYVGTYTRPIAHVPEASGGGISVLDFDLATGGLAPLQEVGGIENPSYLCISADGRRLHAVWEVFEWAEGLVGSYAIDASDGRLTHLGVQGSRGWLAVFTTMDSRSRAAVVANYGSGSVALLPIRANGSLSEARAFDQHEGSGPNAERQEGPHAHCIVISPDDAYAFSADLGIDKVIGYRLDLDEMTLVPHSELTLPPGSGPRHIAFSPDGRHAYVINELTSSVAALDYDAAGGTLRLIDIYPALPAEFARESTCAAIRVHPSGRFLYGSNRGHDSITMFRIDGDDGSLSLLGHRSTEGATPRDFAISPDGRFLLAANQDSDSIVVMPIDEETGALGETVTRAEVSTPVCVQFAPLGASR